MNPRPNLPLLLPLTFIFSLILASLSTASSRISPSPSPDPAVSPHLSIFSPASAPTDGLVPANSNCWTRCQDIPYLTACLENSLTDPKEAFLLVKNDGEDPLKVKVTISQAKTKVLEIKIPKHDAKKVNVSAIVGGSRSIVLRTGNGKCIIHMGSAASGANVFRQFSLFTTHGNPMYLLFFSALIIGVTLACCKSRTSRQHGNGVPYQELEMEKVDSLSAEDVETKEGWDQDWDGEWGDTQAVQYGAPQLGNVSANGLKSRSSDLEGGETNWND